jgi:hypothetical protein
MRKRTMVVALSDVALIHRAGMEAPAPTNQSAPAWQPTESPPGPYGS